MTQIVHLSDIHVSDAHFLADVAGKVVDSINEIAPDIVVSCQLSSVGLWGA